MTIQPEAATHALANTDSELSSLLVTWQNPESRRYYLMGTLQKTEKKYRFAYYPKVELEPGFRMLPGFRDSSKTYEASVLFPLFSSRLMSTKRSDRPDWLHSFDLDESATAIEILSRSLGRRVGDNIELLPEPHIDFVNRRVWGQTPIHGLRYKTDGQQMIAHGALKRGDKLTVTLETTNLGDHRARLVCTTQGVELGYLPRPLLDYLDGLGYLNGVPEATVEFVNPDRYEIHQQVQISYSWQIG